MTRIHFFGKTVEHDIWHYTVTSWYHDLYHRDTMNHTVTRDTVTCDTMTCNTKKLHRNNLLYFICRDTICLDVTANGPQLQLFYYRCKLLP